MSAHATVENAGSRLPTPLASDGMGGRSRRANSNRPPSLNVIAQNVEAASGQWGKYAEAIAYHADALGMREPLPTVPGIRGQPVISPRFVEWMMMLPEGWVTDTEVARTRQIAMLGNGVVPAQALAAIETLEAMAQLD